MNKHILCWLLTFLFISTANQAQYFEWIKHYPSTYSFNPDMVGATLSTVPSGGEVNVRLDSFTVFYSQDAFGKLILERRDQSGTLLWDINFSNKVFVKKVVVDRNDNIYLCGAFMDTLDFNGMGQLINLGTGFNVNFYLAKFDPNGTLIWSQNLALNHSQTSMEDIEIDPQDQMWYSLNDFNNSFLYKVDSNGDDIDSLIQQGAQLLSSFSFDPWGNIFIAGATSNGTLTFGNQSYTTTHSYNKFIGRYDIHRNASWAYFAEDITFQESKVISDEYGNAYLGGLIYDSTDFGTLHFLRPQWSSEFFLLKIDSAGAFQWGISNPAGNNPISGRFNPTSKEAFDVDQAGNIYMAGRSAGVLDWGNGIVLTAGMGQFQDNETSVLSFDGNGIIRWGKIFGSDTYNNFHTLKVTPAGDCYFNASYRDNSAFDSIAFIGNSLLNFVVGKISAHGLTDIHELKQKNHSIYPVPSTEFIQFSGVELNCLLEIFDLSGKLILSQQQNTHDALNITDLNQGFYFLKLNDGKRTEIFSLIKY